MQPFTRWILACCTLVLVTTTGLVPAQTDAAPLHRYQIYHAPHFKRVPQAAISARTSLFQAQAAPLCGLP